MPHPTQYRSFRRWYEQNITKKPYTTFEVSLFINNQPNSGKNITTIGVGNIGSPAAADTRWWLPWVAF